MNDLDSISCIVNHLNSSGYALASVEHNSVSEISTTAHASAFLMSVGRVLKSHTSFAILSADCDDNDLPVHVEGLHHPDGVLKYFGLACITPSVTGGETVLYDSIEAASIILSDYPSIADFRINYTSSWDHSLSCEHPIVKRSSVDGKPRLFYRASVPANRLVTIGKSENEIYSSVDDAISRAVCYEHKWKQGDILLVNNQLTLHNRRKFDGTRIMIRARYDEPGSKCFYD